MRARSHTVFSLIFAVVASSSGCGDDGAPADTGTDTGAPADTGMTDTAPPSDTG
ncbi:MAG: hypothetical protein GWN07_23815, partial [Actinobacteria bacterium]|nr:hypothetical protein [Actinomycetota bacterium]NIX22690.1 hypothetical protein [Actinomycetota bacterium]